MRFGDFRRLLDATYKAKTEDHLVASLARAATAELKTRVCVATYDVDAMTCGLRARSVGSCRYGNKLERAFVDALESLQGGFVKQSLAVAATTRSANTLVIPPEVDGFLRLAKAADHLTVNGWDGEGRGVLLSALLPRELQLTPSEGTTWTRIAAHSVAAVRLFQHDDEPAAILSHDATVLEVNERLAQDAPFRAVLAIGKAIADVRRSEPTSAPSSLGRVPPRIAAEWTLVARFVDDGHDHIVLRQNPAPAPGSEELTTRERQVLALLEAGHHMKLVAYELGISYPTVRVLAARARRRRARAKAGSS